MNAEEARRSVKRLIEVRKLMERSMAAVKRKRRLRPSEMVMTLSSYGQDVDALQNAIDLMVKTYQLKLGEI